jgi:hypothetical protein
VLEAVYLAGGFEDARVWFLTGHTVTEVFFDGRYHYFDSDMMGYNPMDSFLPLKQRPVASVHEIELNGNIILGKMKGPKEVNSAMVDAPWYPADVRAGAIQDLAELLTTTQDNHLYAFQRHPRGHSMDFVLRPGERMIRYFKPEQMGLYYLPYKYNGQAWSEFPQEIKQYQIRTEDGPHSQKDGRLWATGRIEYRPPLADGKREFDMPCPYVIIDAKFQMNVSLPAAGDVLSVETSVDGGRTWTTGSSVQGPYKGMWAANPGIITKSEHGDHNAVAGTYGYQVRVKTHAVNGSTNLSIRDLLLTTRFQVNPRTLPALTAGMNELEYHASKGYRRELPVRADCREKCDVKTANATFVNQNGQGYVINKGSEAGEVIFPLTSKSGIDLTGFDVGARFLDLRDGLAPDKLTAEVRKVEPWPLSGSTEPEAEIAWARQITGPYTTIWKYDSKPRWRDGVPLDRTLRWPEVDRHIGTLPSGTQQVYVRYRFRGMAADSFRLAAWEQLGTSTCQTMVTHTWRENGVERHDTRRFADAENPQRYTISIGARAVVNESVALACLAY